LGFGAEDVAAELVLALQQPCMCLSQHECSGTRIDEHSASRPCVVGHFIVRIGQSGNHVQGQQHLYPGALPPPPQAYPQQQQYYQAYPAYPPYPIPQQETKSGGGFFSPFIWIGVGIVAATIYQKVTSFFQGGPQAAQARMMSWVCLHSCFTDASKQQASADLMLRWREQECMLEGITFSSSC
jgi:hypothetical protein